MTYMGEHARRGRGDRVEVLAPSLPGRYELRYLLDQRRHLVARQALDVAPLRVSLDAPPSARAGGPLTVGVIGEANPSDFVVVVPEGAPSDDTQLKNLHARLGRDLTRVQFRNLPREPGQYEIRYLIDRGRVVAARRALRIEAPTP
jgi:Ca-activated chloride channel family protein